MSGNVCDLCNNRDSDHFETIVDNSYTIAYIMCTRCGLVRQWPRSSDLEVEWFNNKLYRDPRAVEVIESYERHRAEAQFLMFKDEMLPPTSILDIGCSTGELLSRLSRYWSSADTYGVEPINIMAYKNNYWW